MRSKPTRAYRPDRLALIASIGLWCALEPVLASAGSEPAVLTQRVESETLIIPPTEDPYEESAPPAQGDDDDDEGQVDEGCLFMERPLELIV